MWCLASILIAVCPAILQAQDVENGVSGKQGNPEPKEGHIAPVPPSTVDPTESTSVLTRGDAAPFTGMLLGDTRFAELQTAELELKTVRLKLDNANQAYEDTRVVADACVAELEQSGGPAWYASTEFWGGVVVGVGLSVATAWLGYELDVF